VNEGWPELSVLSTPVKGAGNPAVPRAPLMFRGILTA
jgi:hypothetical protein